MIEISDFLGTELGTRKEIYGVDGLNVVVMSKESPLGVTIVHNLDFYKIKLNSKSIRTTVNILNKQDLALNINLNSERNELEEKRFNRKIDKVVKKLEKRIKILNIKFEDYNTNFNLIPTFFVMSNIENIIILTAEKMTLKQLRSLLKNGANRIQLQIKSIQNKNIFAGLSEHSISKKTKIIIVSVGSYYKNNNFGVLSKVKNSFFNKVSYFQVEFNYTQNLSDLRVLSNLMKIYPKIKGKIFNRNNRLQHRGVNVNKNIILKETDVLRLIENFKYKLTKTNV